MSDPNKLRRRLNRLGRSKKRTRAPQKAKPAHSQNAPLPGEEVSASSGRVLRIEKRFPLQHRHGVDALARFLQLDPHLFSSVVETAHAQGLPDRWFFLDTETTGLAGGAGTFAFLVGAGFFAEDHFCLRQYFMRSPSEEDAMLEVLKEDFGDKAGFVTYNGRIFDLPLLEMRYMISRRERIPLGRLPQLDLLYLVRRLWPRALPDCKLSTVEKMVLGVERSGEDVPGALIPAMYQRYLQTGYTGEMLRVLYHNEIDILSLVVLAVQLLERHGHQQTGELSASEALGLARWHLNGGRSQEAEVAFDQAVCATEDDLRAEALRHQTAYLKQMQRRAEAVPGWEAWHQLAPADPAPCIELAKYYEWHAVDLARALKWTRAAEESLESWPEDWRKERAQADTAHRRVRLERKLRQGQEG